MPECGVSDGLWSHYNYYHPYHEYRLPISIPKTMLLGVSVTNSHAKLASEWEQYIEGMV